MMTLKKHANPWADIDAALDAWLEQRRELDARLSELLGVTCTRDGEPVSRIEVDEHGRLLARLGRAGVVHARDAETLVERAIAALVAAADACDREAQRHPSSRSSAPMVRHLNAMARLRAVLDQGAPR